MGTDSWFGAGMPGGTRPETSEGNGVSKDRAQHSIHKAAARQAFGER